MKNGHPFALFMFYAILLELFNVIQSKVFYVRSPIAITYVDFSLIRISVLRMLYGMVIYIGTIQVLRHQRGGWGQKMAIFDDLQYCKSSKRRVGLKKSKT